MTLLFSLAALASAQSAPAIGPQEPTEGRFRRCTEQIRTDPALAIGTANAWLIVGGGIHARQCLGLAYVAQQRWSAAADEYERAAREAQSAQDPRQSDLWVQAGNAWIAAGDHTKAILALDQALATTSLTDELRGEVHLDRGRALVALGNLPGARQEIDRGLQLVPADPFAWYLSAALARREGNLTKARGDISRALEISPDSPDVQLLAGTLAGLAGDLDEAERLYRRVAERAPDSEAGRAALASLSTVREVEQPAASTEPPQPQSQPPQSR